MILHQIVEHKWEELHQKMRICPIQTVKAGISKRPPIRNFKRAIFFPRSWVKLIAEIKMASPTAGRIISETPIQTIAQIYEANGASAISVVVDEEFFKGRLEFISQIKAVTSLPILCKDFVVDEYQIYEAASCGADAILLIVAILDRERLSRFINIARELEIEPVCEVHNQEELNRLLDVDTQPSIVGINNRNLYTFAVDVATTIRLRLFLPYDRVVISESGISTSNDMKLLFENRIDAALVGEVLLRSKDIGEKVRELLGSSFFSGNQKDE